jgi:hypothetical protein
LRARTDEADEVLVTAGSSNRLREWIVNHDESWLFVVSYITLAVVLSIWISLFWLLVVIGMHLVLEWIRQREVDPRPGGVLLRALWELKLDFALFLFALALTAYMDVVMGIAGLGGAARLGMQSGARVGGWGRAIRGVLLSLDDAAQAARAVVAVGGNSRESADMAGDVEPPSRKPAAPPNPIAGRWGIGDHVAIWLGAVCLLLLLAAPVLTGQDAGSLLQALAAEMQPFPASPPVMEEA